MAGPKHDDLEAVRIVVEAIQDFSAEEQRRIIRWAQEKLGLSAAAMRGVPMEDDGTRVLEPVSRTRDIRTFLDDKRPSSDVHFAAAVAYFYAFEAPVSERKQEVTANDLQEAARMAGRERLAKPIVTLHNAMKAGYLNKGPERGSFRINTVGENLVAMAMPTSEASTTARTRRPPSTRKVAKPKKGSPAKRKPRRSRP